MKYISPFLVVFTGILISHSTLAVDIGHVFNRDSITRKPIRSDYNSDQAFAVDSLVYGIPRVCSFVTTTGPDTESGFSPWVNFTLGSNLMKDPNNNWYANASVPQEAPTFSSFLYVNSDTGSVVCGANQAKQWGIEWSNGGKWYKTFDLVLKNPPSDYNSQGTNNIQSTLPDCRTKREWTNCFGTAIYKNGAEYSGEFKNRNPHGKGRYTTVDGSSYKVVSENGKLISKTEITPPRRTKQKRSKPSLKDNSKQKTSFEDAKKECESIGLKMGTEDFGKCVIKLME